jgi:ABC-type transport system involved in Fe-S cluster assembly fused permease/ATPase subunit
VVSKGGNSFQQVLRFIFFNITPMVLQTIFFLGILLSLYGYQIFLINLVVVVFFYIITLVVTEWRSKYFKLMATQDARNTQVATDSLINFETVKYFNAETHE